MSDRWGNAVAWSAGVSTAGAGLAVLFISGKALWQRIGFTIFLMIAGGAFLFLLAAGLQGLLSARRARRLKPGNPDTESETASETAQTDGDHGSPRIWVQENTAHDQGSVFGVQGGSIVVHRADQVQPPAEPPPSRAVHDHEPGQS
jgi:hypothetical protein